MAAEIRSQRMKLTDHAVDRYRQRWAPDLDRENAEKVLLTIVAQASPLRLRTLRKGQEVWAAGEVRFVVKRDAGENVPVVVTVLPKLRPTHEQQDLDAYEEWLEEQREHTTLTVDHEKLLDLARVELELATRDKAEAEALASGAKEWLAEVNRRIVSAKERIGWHKRQSPQVRT